MQRGVGDGNTAHEHGRKPRHGGDCAGAADLHVNRFHGGERFFGGEFVRNRPTRRARHEAEFFLFGQRVHFDHHAVDFIRQAGAVFGQPFVFAQHGRRAGVRAEIAFGQGKTEFVQQREFFHVAFR